MRVSTLQIGIEVTPSKWAFRLRCVRKRTRIMRVRTLGQPDFGVLSHFLGEKRPFVSCAAPGIGVAISLLGFQSRYRERTFLGLFIGLLGF